MPSMRQRFVQYAAALLAAASALLLLPAIAAGCGSSVDAPPEDPGLAIRGCAQVPRDSCSVLVKADGPFVTQGRLDGLYRDEYLCQAIFQNRRADKALVTLEEVRVSVESESGEAIASFTGAVSGVVDPGDVAGTSVKLLDAAAAKKLTELAVQAQASQHVVVKLTASARTSTGKEIESNELSFPLEICAGCSCAKPTGDSCVGSSQKPAADCLFGQETYADCRVLADMDACKLLECDQYSDSKLSDLTTARCPAKQGPADGSCCNPP